MQKPFTYLLAVASFVLTAAYSIPNTTGVRPPTQSCDDPFKDTGALKFETRGWTTDFCKHSVPFDEFMSGGPPRDGIPPIDNPSFVSVPEANEWIGEREPVIAVSINGDVRAYPLQVLTWHEIVNDVVGNTPVAITFCPLCYTAIVFVRPAHGSTHLTFGTTGNLRYSDLVMWDRQTESWWQQFNGEAIVGSLTGTKLEAIAAPLVSWSEFRSQFPDAVVLSKDTGFDRRYGENPYVGYDDVSERPWLYNGPVGEALRPMERVIGVEIGTSYRAYQLSDLSKTKTINDTLGNQPIVLFWTKGAASALDKREIADSRRIGSVGVYRAEVDGRTLRFKKKGRGEFIDGATSSTWNLFGEATDGPLLGTRLEAVMHHNTFWFVWSAFKDEAVSLYQP